jgi:NAD(P)-dependent dehydrogenase (short-subunit alcohol dehydrogenase family)
LLSATNAGRNEVSARRHLWRRPGIKRCPPDSNGKQKKKERKMKIVVIDGQGGGLGKSIVTQIRKEWEQAEIAAMGANAIATAAMMKAGPDYAATGENAIVHNCKDADVIIGPLGIGFAHSLHGEISPRIAYAVSASHARKILIPISKCNVSVAGVAEKTVSQYLDEMISLLKTHMPQS